MSSTIVYWAMVYSSLYGIDPALTLSVIKVESNFRPALVGAAGEVGLMQIMPQYTNVPRQSLFDIKTNIRVGVEKLAKFKNECKHKEDKTWIICYNMGTYGASKVKHPKLWPYYKKVYGEYLDMSKTFKPGQQVMVIGAYGNTSDGEGVIIKPSRIKEYAGKWLVDLGETILPVEPERLVDAQEYWDEKRRQREALD